MNEYYNLHNENIKIGYKDVKGNLQMEDRQGFLNIYNVNDSKIICNQETNCPEDLKYIDLPTIIMGRPGLPPSNYKRNKFKVFIPEGAVSMNLMIYCNQEKVATVVKYNTSPNCVQCNKDYDQTNFIKENTFNFSFFEKEEVYLQNAGGHITIYSTSLLEKDKITGQYVPRKNSGWLYVNNYYNSSAIGQVQFGLKVHKEIFSNWYNSYTKDIYNLGGTVTPNITEFQKGINYCKENPQKCGIIDLNLDTLTLKLNSLDIPSNGNTIRYNVLLEFVGTETELLWKLDLSNLTPIEN